MKECYGYKCVPTLATLFPSFQSLLSIREAYFQAVRDSPEVYFPACLPTSGTDARSPAATFLVGAVLTDYSRVAISVT